MCRGTPCTLTHLPWLFTLGIMSLTWPCTKWFCLSKAKYNDWEWSWSGKSHSWHFWRRNPASKFLSAIRWVKVDIRRSCCRVIGAYCPSNFEQRTHRKCRSEKRRVHKFIKLQSGCNAWKKTIFLCPAKPRVSLKLVSSFLKWNYIHLQLDWLIDWHGFIIQTPLKFFTYFDLAKYMLCEIYC